VINNMEMIHSYGKIFTMGHAAIKEIFLDDVLVEEKIDGSQFSFGILNGELFCRSKGKQLVVEAPEKMFNLAVETIKEIAPRLMEGVIYRGEYLNKPKHNVLAYDRIPKKNIIIFDIELPGQNYMTYEGKVLEAERLGFEVVPKMFEGRIEDITDLYKILEMQSVLGGQKVEGFVVKNYNRFGKDGKVLLGKYVSEGFKEVHSHEWKEANPSTGDILERIVQKYKTPSRWTKAVQHLKERGELTSTPKDIGPLMIETRKDIREECMDEIKQELFRYAWDHIERRLTGGLPEWYKRELLKSQFEE